MNKLVSFSDVKVTHRDIIIYMIFLLRKICTLESMKISLKITITLDTNFKNASVDSSMKKITCKKKKNPVNDLIVHCHEVRYIICHHSLFQFAFLFFFFFFTDIKCHTYQNVCCAAMLFLIFIFL